MRIFKVQTLSCEDTKGGRAFWESVRRPPPWSEPQAGWSPCPPQPWSEPRAGAPVTGGQQRACRASGALPPLQGSFGATPQMGRALLPSVLARTARLSAPHCRKDGGRGSKRPGASPGVFPEAPALILICFAACT